MKQIKIYKVFIAIVLSVSSTSFGQIIYQHAYGTSTFSAVNPYTVTPNIIDPNLNTSQWSTSVAAGFTSFAGATGQALSLSNSSGTPTYSLTFNVAPGYTCSITDYSFWRVRSSAGAQNWTLSVNGATTIGTGTVPTTGANTGTLAVSSLVNGLSGTVNVVLQLAGASGAGTFRLDDFTLYGTVNPTVTCTPPVTQATSFSVTSATSNSVDINWTPGSGGSVIVLASAGSPVSGSPTSGNTYVANSVYGSGQQIGVGNYVVYDGTGSSASITGLTPGAVYYFSVFEYNTASGFPCYLTPALTGSATAGNCVPPITQASMFNASSIGATSVTVSWTAGSGGNALVLARSVTPITVTPTSGTTYTAPSTVYGAGQQIGTGNYIVYNGTGTSVTVTNLNPSTLYYFEVFEYNTSSGTPCYLTPGLDGNVTTTSSAPTSTNCIVIKSILVDACQANATNYESYNEMVYFKNGPNPLPINQLSIAGAPSSGVYASGKWPNNGNLWNGVIQNTLTASNVSTINGSIINCGYVLEPPLVSGVGTIPPYANVILVGCQTMNPLSNSFANLTDTIYMIFQAASTTTAGNFVNWSSGASGTRGLVLIDNANACTSNSVTYEPALLLNHADGDAVSYDLNNNPTYYNSGCQAPFIPLSVDAGANQTICYNSTAALSATASGVYNSVLWSGGAGAFSSPTTLTSTYTPGVSETGTIKLYCTITRSCSTSSSSTKDSVYITITSLPLYSFNASNGYSLCPSATSVISYSVSNAGNAGVLTPAWTSPAGSGTSYTVSAPGGTTAVTYTLNLSNSCGSTVKTFTVYPLALPTVTLSAHTLTACVGNTLSLSASGNTGNYSWSNPVSTNSTVVITAGSSTTGVVSSTNTCGTATDSYTLTVTPNPTLSVSNSNVSLCTGQSSTVTATSSIGTYTWMPGSMNSNSIVVNASGTHTVYSGNTCQTTSATVNVVMSSAASLTISSTSNTLCASGQTAVLSTSGSSGTYLWSDGSSTSTISISTPGVYSATVTTPGCGSAVDSYTVNAVQIPTLSVSPTTTLLCNGQAAILTSSSNLTNYQWSNLATNVNTISVNSPGTYTVGVSNACGSPTASVIVTTDNTPILNLTASSLTLCPNQTATLTVNGGVGTYTWSNTSNTSSVVTTNGGTVTVSNTNNCGTGTASVVVSVNPLNAVISANPTSGTKPLIVDFTNNSIGAISYNWNFGNGNSATTQTVGSQTYSVSGNYWVSLTVSNGACSDVDSLMITVNEDEPWIIIPNVFTPNGDTTNDVFKITGYYHIKEFNCTIFDRWGLQMFEWSEIKEGWDGTNDGNKVPDGTYFYIINAKDIDGKEIKKQGAILLIR